MANSSKMGRVFLSTALFSVLLVVLVGILLFLSKHEPDPTPDQVGLLQPASSTVHSYRS